MQAETLLKEKIFNSFCFLFLIQIFRFNRTEKNKNT